jgi:hypothetical protein
VFGAFENCSGFGALGWPNRLQRYWPANELRTSAFLDRSHVQPGQGALFQTKVPPIESCRKTSAKLVDQPTLHQIEARGTSQCVSPLAPGTRSKQGADVTVQPIWTKVALLLLYSGLCSALKLGYPEQVCVR